MKIEFAEAYVNVLLLFWGLFILLFLYARQHRKKRAMLFGNIETLKKVSDQGFIESSKIMLVVRLLAVSCLVIAAANPVLVTDEPVAEADYVIAMDNSGSMVPDRLQAARDITGQFLSELSNTSQVGLVFYAGTIGNTTNGLTTPQRARSMVDNLEMGASGGTATGDAITTSVNMLLNAEQQRRILLVTDGISNRGISINESVAFAKQHNVSIYTIGLGDETNSTGSGYEIVNGVNVSRADYPNINRTRLANISAATGGESIVVQDEDTLQAAFVSLAYEDVETDLYLVFVFGAVLLFLIDFLYKTTRYASLP